MKAKNQFEKYKYYVLKKKDIIVQGLQKSQRLGRKIGPKVVLNSLPKSGTHLLESLFFKLPLMRHCGQRTLRIETQNPIKPKLDKISSLKKGQFLLSHMQFDKSITEIAHKNSVKIIHLTRDPRDVLLSHLNYIEKMDTTQMSHKFIVQYNNRMDKLKAMIEGKRNILEPFLEVLDKFKPWIDAPNILVIKFEDLIGSKGGGSDEKQKESVKKICDFLSIELENNELKKICSLIYSPKSSTFNKGMIGNWENILDEKEKLWLNTILKEQLKDYKYSFDF